MGELRVRGEEFRTSKVQGVFGRRVCFFALVLVVFGLNFAS